MTPTELEAFRKRMGWNRKRLGTELDISQDRLRRFLSGRVSIPRYIALACTALAMGDRPMGET
jgi:transcriptional regulator with XRE-family HTH domain